VRGLSGSTLESIIEFLLVRRKISKRDEELSLVLVGEDIGWWRPSMVMVLRKFEEEALEGVKRL
jgi:hypothetical protein